MRVFLIIIFISNIFADPAQYQVYKTDKPPTIDGDLSDWSEDFFIDTMYSDDNVILRDMLTLWTPDDFNAKLYMCWDETNVYIAVGVIRDDSYILTSPSQHITRIDNLRLTDGNPATAVEIGANGQIRTNPSSPFTIDQDLFAEVNPFGPDSLPVYEISMQKSLLDFYELNKIRYFIGTWENDDTTGADQIVMGFGVEAFGDKQDWNSSRDDNPLYYPIYTLLDSIPMKRDTLMYKVVSTGIQCFIEPCPYYELMDCNGTPLDTVSGIIDTQGNIIDINDLKGSNRAVYGFIHEDSLSGWYFKANVLEVIEIRNDCNVSIEGKYKPSGALTLGPPSPNPFKPATRIPYNPGPGKQGTLKIFDVRGKMVFEKAITGTGAVIWKATGQSSGIYIIRLKIGDRTYQKRVSLIK